MTATFRIVLAATLVAASTSTASAQFGGGSLRGTGVSLAYDAPAGDLDRIAGTGFGFALNTGLSDTGDSWSGRGKFAFDRFAGKGSLDNLQFISFGLDFVHKSTPALYQFAGFSISNANYSYESTTAAGLAGTRNGSNFGLTGGVGINFGEESHTRTFVEFAVMTVFTGKTNSSWFPMRFGVRF
jgi:hypothetical protein